MGDALFLFLLWHLSYRRNLELLLTDLTQQKKYVQKHGLKVDGKSYNILQVRFHVFMYLFLFCSVLSSDQGPSQQLIMGDYYIALSHKDWGLPI